MRAKVRDARRAAHLRPVERREAVCEIVAEAAAVEEQFLPVLAAAEDVARGARQHEAPRRAVGVGAPRLRPPPRVEAGTERARVGARACGEALDANAAQRKKQINCFMPTLTH